MDIVHHALIGGVGMTALAAQGQELAGLGFLAGSVFPDLDVAFMAAGKRFYLKHHQGPTHSLPIAPLYAGALLGLFSLAGGEAGWALFWGLLAGMCLHIGLDYFNTFGIQLGWPLTPRRYCRDAVFFIDAVAWALTLGFYAAVFGFGVDPRPAAAAYAALLAAYFAAKQLLQRRLKARLGVDLAIPSALDPFGFFLLSRRDGRLETGYYHALSGRMRAQKTIDAVPREIAELADRSAVFRDMRSILRGLHVTRVERDASGTTVVAEDLAVRNFGGRFGKTELRFDGDGRLTHEMAHI